MAPRKTLKRGGDKKDRVTPYSQKSGGGDKDRSGADKSSTPEIIQLNEERLVQALQTRIGVPIYGIGTLRRYLEDADWVQDVAYEGFTADAGAVGTARSSSEGRAGLPDNIRGVPVVIHINQEEQRREAVRLLRAVINVDRDPANRVQITLSEAILTLVLTAWDVEAGAIRWASPDVIRWQLHHTFDHLRTTTTNQVEMDERLALTVHLTGRDDWHSIRDFLVAHNQRFLQATIAWYRFGIPAVRTLGWNNSSQLYVGRRVTYNGQPRSPMPSDSEVVPMQVNEDAWADESTTFRPAGDIPDDGLAQPPQSLQTNKTKRVRGFCLTPEGDPPELGGVMPAHFTIDYVQKGKYKANGFDWKDYYRPELPESDANDSDNPVFNEYVSKHIAHLGRWRRQQYSRIEQTKKKETPQDFSKEEKKHLFDLCERHLQTLVVENPDKSHDDFKPLQFRGGATEKLEKDFNDKFEGKKPGKATEPRRHRKGTALKVKCGRIKKFRIAFGFRKTKGPDDSDSSSDDSSASEGGPPSRSLPGEPERPTEPISEQSAKAQREQNKAEEDATEDIEALAEEHRQSVRRQAEDGLRARDADLMEANIVTEMGVILNAEARNGKLRADLAPVVRRVIRDFGMIVPGEEDVGQDQDVFGKASVKGGR